MIHRARELLLEREIRRGSAPSSIALVISREAMAPRWWRKVGEVAGWCSSLGIREATLFAPACRPEIGGTVPPGKTSNETANETAKEVAEELMDLPVSGRLLVEDGDIAFGKGGPLDLVISLDCGGKAEVTRAIRSVLEDVSTGLIEPSEINEGVIEERLRLKQRPDLLIRLGGRELSDFMIWQSAYSELYFIDRGWNSMKKVDFLRAVRDYQRRERRFGR
ncbi:undecaprenyl diphosphate synthase family protein [Candidatus Methanocrinis natronophilus]|uniref:Undecaprenyl diphosphate synthase family protein n=1 Tax=Candidatus Methanocrinis natronophilus TaxID=3033396 RepID=A0ABT5XA69_9EURY|nr:undecaprenyl diphosphate synthase family protein [Candidatus Methanocrinis natronophilus]MDF0591557.1 undecaprenyl diphosphate synthase family protein [Candidatus Methanocrinis natronophilus]